MGADKSACRFGPDSSHVDLAADVLRLLSDPTRIKIILILRDSGELTVGQLAEVIGRSPTCTSQHLAKLRLARVVDARQDGNRAIYHLVDQAARELVALAVFQAERALGLATAHGDQATTSQSIPTGRRCAVSIGHGPLLAAPALAGSARMQVPA